MTFFLKEVQDTDIVSIHKGLSDKEVTRYYDVHFPTLKATEEQMLWYKTLKQEDKGVWFCIYDKQTKEFCGAGGFNDLNKQHQKAEIGFWLLKDYWGKGILHEVMPLLFEIGFVKLNLNRIEGFVVSSNVKCKKALAKVEFVYEGTMRATEFKDGEFIDVDIYAILKKDWTTK